MYLLQFFVYEHLRDDALKAASKPFCEAARLLNVTQLEMMRGPDAQATVQELLQAVEKLPENPEQAWARRKLTDLISLMRAYPNGEGGVTKEYGLRLLLEAKDCGVRAVLFQPEYAAEPIQSA